MASVAAIYNVPRDDQSLLEWSFNHMAHHRDINRVIFQRLNIFLPEFSLDPFNPDEIQGVWAQQHQIMHTNQNAVLSISGNDLLDVNWRDEGEREAWIGLNALEHFQANAILEV